MRTCTLAVRGASLAVLLIPISGAGSAAPPPETKSDSGHVATAPLPAVDDTSMLTGSGVNTNSWPIDRPVQGGAMRKLPGHRDWIFVRALTDAQMRQLGKTREDELLRLHGNEPRHVEIAIPDSAALRKLARFAIKENCVPPCTLTTRILYRDLPRLQRDSLVFWDLRKRKAPAPLRTAEPPPAPHSASPRPGK